MLLFLLANPSGSIHSFIFTLRQPPHFPRLLVLAHLLLAAHLLYNLLRSGVVVLCSFLHCVADGDVSGCLLDHLESLYNES